MSTTLFTVNHLANLYASRKVAQDLPDARKTLLQGRAAYDFTVTGFNVASAATIAAVAAAILIHSPFSLIMAALAYGLRNAFKKELIFTAVPVENRLPQMLIGNINLNARKEELLNHFELAGAQNWNPMRLQFFDFEVWMNWLPEEVVAAGPAAVAIENPPENRDAAADQIRVAGAP